MTYQEKGPLAANQVGLQMQLPVANSTRKRRKWEQILRAFLAGRSYNRFEFERQLHNHCLCRTVAKIQGIGITIHLEDESVPGPQGVPTSICRYRLLPESRQRAAEILGTNGDSHVGA